MRVRMSTGAGQGVLPEVRVLTIYKSMNASNVWVAWCVAYYATNLPAIFAGTPVVCDGMTLVCGCDMLACHERVLLERGAMGMGKQGVVRARRRDGGSARLCDQRYACMICSVLI